MIKFAETYQNRGEWVVSTLPFGLNSNLYYYFNFPNLNNKLCTHFIKDFGGFFLLPFKRFRFFFCNPLVDYNTNITLYLEKTKLIQV